MKHMFQQGRLIITLSDGSTTEYGDGTGKPIHLRSSDPSFARLVLKNPDLGVGEAYMDGRMTLDDDDLEGFLALAVQNIGRTRATSRKNRIFLHRLQDGAQRLLHGISQRNPLGQATQNVAHHYDLSEELYDLFLDEDRQYSCAYFENADDSLEQAQLQKKLHIAQKLWLTPGMRVLDIGCGWGGMALTLAEKFGVEVVGVTLSKEQLKIAKERAANRGLADKVDFRLLDYRLLDEKFDRIVSVGMFEHVGAPNYLDYFTKISDLLKDDGIALVHTIGRNAPPGITSPWILKYIFPGGYIPALSEAVTAVEVSGLAISDVEVWRMHYAETLLHWRKRFENNVDRISKIYDERFCRMWRYYLIASEMTFRYDRQVVHQIQLIKASDSLPLTRDYLYRNS